MRLQRSLTSIETWGFGLTGLVLWTNTAPGIQAELGPQAIFVWIPGVIVGVLINLQVRRLGMHWPQVVGGTPNYMTRLLENYPRAACYGALGYFISWVAVLPVNAIILTDLIKANLQPFGIACPEIPLKIGFTLIAFVVAFSGTRTLGILHLSFVLPAVGLLLTFCAQGMGWLVFAPASPGLLLPTWPSFDFTLWAKWFIVATYAVYACETASSFVADSQRPQNALRCLLFAASLITPVYLGGSWVLLRLAPPGAGDNTFLSLLAAAEPFWGHAASFLVTFLIVSSSLLSCATAVSNSPRVLYQLALDGHLSPVFTVVTRRGVLGPSLILTLLLSLLWLIWGDVPRIVMVTGVSWLVSCIALHLGLWLQRARPEVQWPWCSLGFFIMESVVLIVGGLAWSWQDLVIGLLLPIAVLAVDAVIRRLPFWLFHPAWWVEQYRTQHQRQSQDFVLLQVGVLILLICGATAVGWVAKAKLDGLQANDASTNLFVTLLLVMGFLGVAIACWTSLPQVASMVEAREKAEHLFNTALDAIIGLDEDGVIRQANPATEPLFGVNTSYLIGQRLNKQLPGLTDQLNLWPSRSEQTLVRPDHSLRIVEVAISSQSRQDFLEYVVLLRDITNRKEMEVALQESEERLKAVLDNSTALIYVKDTQGRYLMINHRCETLFHVTKEAVQGKTDYDFFSRELADILQSNDKKVLEAGTALEWEEVVDQDDGSHTYLALKFPLFSSTGVAYGVCGISTDITQRKQAEVDVRSALEKEKQLGELKSRFVTTASHEFRTPLTTILSSTELLEHYSHKWAEEKKRTHLQRIQTAVKYMTGLLNDVLLIGKAEAGKLDFQPTQLDLTQFCQNLVEEMQVSTGSHVIALATHDQCPNACMDEKLLRHILSNLLSNAIKYSPEAGTVYFDLICAEAATFRIRDQGIGIPETDQAQLFDSFHRASNVGTISGTGLGLAIVKQSVELHGGQIMVESEVGVGTTFTVTLPLNHQKSVVMNSNDQDLNPAM